MEELAGMRSRISALCFNLLLFSGSYLLLNAAAASQDVQRSVQFAFERNMPFLPWMILPYLTSGLLIAWLFLQGQSSEQLRILNQRFSLATLIAGGIFALWPLRFAAELPAVTEPWLAWLFQLLHQIDRPYNQCPSLHVTYVVLGWVTLMPRLAHQWQRCLLGIWLGLLLVSTLLVYQHHLLDVIGGLLLGAGIVKLITRAQSQQGWFYALAALLSLIVGVGYWQQPLSAYLAISFALVSQAHFRGDRFFLHKHDGKHPWWVWLGYAPYLLGYRLTWLLVQWRERAHSPVEQVDTGLWIGRRLNKSQSALLPENCLVVDLSCELSEQPALLRPNRNNRYLHWPLLDLSLPDTEGSMPLLQILDDELAQGGQVYLHCAMGYSRCRQIMQMYQQYTARRIQRQQ